MEGAVRAAAAAPRVRVVVAQPEAGAAAGVHAGLVAVLGGLGREVEVELRRGPRDVLAALRGGGVDLLVIDVGTGEFDRAVLAGLPDEAPPAVVVQPARDQARAAEIFALGAADCIAAGPALDELLPQVALEQIRRHRLRRERRRLERQLRLSEKLASVGQLAGGIVHEINNPLAFVHANLCQMEEYAADLRRVWQRVEALRGALDSGPPEDVRSCAEELGQICQKLDPALLLDDLRAALSESREGSERIRRIVGELRSFARPDPDRPEPADLHGCLEAALRIVSARIEDVAVVHRDYGELPRLTCHPHQLEQVFMNLLVNAGQAIEARDGGKGELGAIHLRTRREGDQLTVSVRDTGVGIPARDLERIFDPFFTSKPAGEGMGLGLSRAFAIAERHGGAIEAESEEGGGSTITVRLPLAAPPRRRAR